MLSNRERFEKFHRENPHVYELFKRFTFEAIKAGKKNLSVTMIIERIRWETDVVTSGEPYKINDIFKPYYSRKFMAEFPEHEGFFPTRRIRVA